MQKFMFDSNAFSNLLKSNIDWTTSFAEHKEEFEFFVTAVQIEELANICDKKIDKDVRELIPKIEELANICDKKIDEDVRELILKIKELANICDENKKELIHHFLCLCYMNAKMVPTPAVVGEARVGMCIVANEQDTYTQLLNENRSNIHDAMIGAAADREGCILITDDSKFMKKLNAAKVPTMTIEKFCETIGLGAKI